MPNEVAETAKKVIAALQGHDPKIENIYQGEQETLSTDEADAIIISAQVPSTDGRAQRVFVDVGWAWE